MPGTVTPDSTLKPKRARHADSTSQQHAVDQCTARLARHAPLVHGDQLMMFSNTAMTVDSDGERHEHEEQARPTRWPSGICVEHASAA